MWVSIAISVFFIYVAISIGVYFFQDFIFFKPEKLPKDFAFNYENLKFDEYILDLHEGVSVSGIHFKADKPKGVVFYLKGNSRSIKGWGKFAVDFNRNGYDVLMVDYRGFGKSTGKRTHSALKEDLQQVYNLIKDKVPEKYIILYGRSLGSGFAAKLASVNNPGLLILDAPYYSLSHVAKRYLPFMPIAWAIRFPIPTYKWLKYVKCPIHIIHGTSDKLIPFQSSIKLGNINPSTSRLHPIIGGGHNNLHNFPMYHKVLDEILHKEYRTSFDIDKSSLNFKRKSR
ncbi:MAG: alpha/beta fold hydrolase [Saprospiraceae bacterium]|nr:alpha/beta fold hydrolase [Saprospiraceae bacterium]MBK8851691.1 alpha/beta fold hydrolase [Saprospiraceae bacterium]MBK9686346.1 alpha/beta fold hydrolase [Saprospiraceae bacterium]MBL0084600.1 alpha/beta fold hydrolase [Saprospiraceae bacterium]